MIKLKTKLSLVFFYEQILTEIVHFKSLETLNKIRKKEKIEQKKAIITKKCLNFVPFVI